MIKTQPRHEKRWTEDESNFSVDDLHTIRDKTKELMEEFGRPRLQPMDIKEQIIDLKDQLQRVAQMKSFFEETYKSLVAMEENKTIEYQGLCELHSSPLTALGDEALSRVFGFI